MFRKVSAAIVTTIAFITVLLTLASRGHAQVVRFSRTTDTIMVPGSSALTATVTYEAWVRLRSNTDSMDARFWNEWKYAQQDDWLYFRGKSQVSAYAYPVNEGDQMLSKSSVTKGVWYHIAYVYDGNQERMYINGVLNASRTGSGGISSVSSPVGAVGAIFRFDAGLFPTASFDLDSLRISNKVRYTGSTFVVPPRDMPSDSVTRLLYWFNECPDSDIVIDHGPLHRDGTLGVGFSGATKPVLSGGIDSHPDPFATCPAGQGTFTVVPTGPGPFTFQWQYKSKVTTGWVDLSDGPNFLGSEFLLNTIGSKSATLTVDRSPALWLNDGEFRCAVTNTVCGAVISDEATLTICLADVDCNGFVNGDDFDQFVEAFEQGDAFADFNGDGFVNGDDFDDFVFAFAFAAGC